MENCEITAKQLRAALKETLAKSGATHWIKAKLRTDFIQQILKDGDVKSITEVNGFRERIVLSCIFNFLQARNLFNTLSVYTSEAQLHRGNILDENDLVQILKRNLLDQEIPSILEMIVKSCFLIAEGSQRDQEVQTANTGPSAKERLAEQIQQLSLTTATPESAEFFEQHLSIYHRELEARKDHEIELQMKTFREQELQKYRLQDSEKLRSSLAALHSELELDYQRRLQFYVERESESAYRLKEEEKRFKKLLHEERQSLEKQLEELKFKESGMARKSELENQGFRLLEIRLKELESKLELKARELDAKEKEMDLKAVNFKANLRQELLTELAAERSRIQSEKVQFYDEKKSLFEEKLKLQNSMLEMEIAQKSLMENQLKVKQLEQANQSLFKELEITKLRIQAEEETILELTKKISPGLEKLNGTERLYYLIKLNSDLMSQLKVLKDPQSLKASLDEKTDELENCQRKIAYYKTEMGQLRNDNEKLKRESLSTEAKLKALEFQLLELRQLLTDKERCLNVLEIQHFQREAPQTSSDLLSYKYYRNIKGILPDRNILSNFSSSKHRPEGNGYSLNLAGFKNNASHSVKKRIQQTESKEIVGLPQVEVRKEREFLPPETFMMSATNSPSRFLVHDSVQNNRNEAWEKDKAEFNNNEKVSPKSEIPIQNAFLSSPLNCNERRLTDNGNREQAPIIAQINSKITETDILRERTDKGLFIFTDNVEQNETLHPLQKQRVEEIKKPSLEEQSPSVKLSSNVDPHLSPQKHEQQQSVISDEGREQQIAGGQTEEDEIQAARARVIARKKAMQKRSENSVVVLDQAFNQQVTESKPNTESEAQPPRKNMLPTKNRSSRPRFDFDESDCDDKPLDIGIEDEGAGDW